MIDLTTIRIIGPLFSVPDAPRRWYHVILWWELRRIAFNIIVGTLGLISVFLFLYLASQRPKQFEEGPEPLAGLMFGVAANIFYTGGWVAELVARLLWRERASFFGPIMFSLGLLLSIILCFVPPVLAGLIWLTSKP